jgi:hypothetical protein
MASFSVAPCAGTGRWGFSWPPLGHLGPGEVRELERDRGAQSMERPVHGQAQSMDTFRVHGQDRYRSMDGAQHGQARKKPVGAQGLVHGI